MDSIRCIDFDEKIDLEGTSHPVETVEESVQASTSKNPIAEYEEIPEELLSFEPMAKSAPSEYPIGTTAICPYNLEHKILPSKMFLHLPRCRAEYMKQNPNFEMVRCRYHGRHFVPDKEIDFHEKTCDDTLYKRILEEANVEPRSWIMPERKDDKQECLDMQDTLARFQAREYMIRMGAKRNTVEDSSDESGDELICDYAPRDITTAFEDDEIHSDDSDQVNDE